MDWEVVDGKFVIKSMKGSRIDIQTVLTYRTGKSSTKAKASKSGVVYLPKKFIGKEVAIIYEPE